MARCEQCLTCDNWDCGVCNVCYPLPVINQDGKCSSYYELKKPVKRKGKKRKKNAEE